MLDLTLASRARCLLVWLGGHRRHRADCRLGGAGRCERCRPHPDVRPARRGRWPPPRCTACAVWAWVVTGVVVAQALGGRPRRRRPGRAALAAAARAPGAAAWPRSAAAPPRPPDGGHGGRSDPRDRCSPACRPPNACSAGLRAVPAGHGPPDRVHVVRPGDTLWDVAAADLGRATPTPLGSAPTGTAIYDAQPRRHRRRPRPDPSPASSSGCPRRRTTDERSRHVPAPRRGRPAPRPGAGGGHPGDAGPGPRAAPRRRLRPPWCRSAGIDGTAWRSGPTGSSRPPSRSSAGTGRRASCCGGPPGRSTPTCERRALLVARAGGHRPGQGRVQPRHARGSRSVHASFVGARRRSRPACTRVRTLARPVARRRPLRAASTHETGCGVSPALGRSA